MDFIAAIVLGIALGITEFVPVSSLGHSLVLASLFQFPQSLNLSGFTAEQQAAAIQNARDAISLFIQGGAVLAVLVYYGRDLLAEARKLPSDPKIRQLWLNVLIAFVPIGILGLLFNKQIKEYLFKPWIVGLALIVGGVILLIVERRKYEPTSDSLEAITPRQALIVGLAQIAALIPGVSRSASTIVGGLFGGLSRETATRFTFYLFIPTLGAAAGYELYKQVSGGLLDKTLLPYFLLAFVVAFVTSLAVIRVLLRYISTHDFKVFGVYRIVVGVLILILFAAQIIK